MGLVFFLARHFILFFEGARLQLFKAPHFSQEKSWVVRLCFFNFRP